MPEWMTHTEGGSWNGGGTEVKNCDLDQRRMLEDAFDDFINDRCLDCFPGLEDCLRDKWAEIKVDCHDNKCQNNSWSAYRSGNKIVICQTTFDDGQDRVNAVLLHELVHACDGTELDSEAVERACYDGAGATTPGGSDEDKFFDETSKWDGDDNVRKGKWVIWDSTTGEVWGIDKSEGAWNESDEESKGDLCFTDSDWVIPDPDGGWV